MNRGTWNRTALIGIGAMMSLGWGCSASHSEQCLDLPADHHAMTAEGGPKVFVNTDDNGLALQGYDPVAYFSLAPGAKPVKGSAEFRSRYKGAIYQFAGARNKAAFDANPAKYEPQFGGWCGYAASINKVSPIGPEYWEIIDGRLVLQHNQKAWGLWHKDVPGNLKKADVNWPGIQDREGAPVKTLINVDKDKVALGGYDAVAYFTLGKPTKGDPVIRSTHQGATYYFASSEDKQRFDAEPFKYEPEFGGFCGYAASINKVSPVNPELWQIVDGRLVLQHTDEAYRLFNKNLAGNYERARENWPGLTARNCK